jgi:hypothetical protein
MRTVNVRFEAMHVLLLIALCDIPYFLCTQEASTALDPELAAAAATAGRVSPPRSAPLPPLGCMRVPEQRFRDLICARNERSPRYGWCARGLNLRDPLMCARWCTRSARPERARVHRMTDPPADGRAGAAGEVVRMGGWRGRVGPWAPRGVRGAPSSWLSARIVARRPRAVSAGP